MSNEPSGSHPVSPPSHTAGVFAIDARTAAMAVFFLASGAGVGGGASLFTGNGLEKRVEELAAEVRTLTRAVDAQSTEKHQIERDHDGMRLMLADHETRLRAIEKPASRRSTP